MFNRSGKYTPYKRFGRANTVDIGNYDHLTKILKGFTFTSHLKRAFEILEKTNQMATPVIEIGDEIIIGFHENKIKAALEKVKN